MQKPNQCLGLVMVLTPTNYTLLIFESYSIQSSDDDTRYLGISRRTQRKKAEGKGCQTRS